MRLSARDQIILFVVVTILAVVAVFFLLIMPRFGELSELEEELVQIEQERVTADALLKRRQDAKAQAAETQVQLLDLASRFPEAPELPALIIELQDVTNRVEIDFVQLSPRLPQELSEVPGVSSVGITMQITGTWEQFIELMAELQDLRRDVRVTQLTVVGVAPALEEEGGSPEGEGTTEEVSEDDTGEEELYTIQATVVLEAYSMASAISGAGDGAEVPPAP
jgi:Tfp pilus assembly protein PilO